MQKFEDYFKIENAIRIYGEFSIIMDGFYEDKNSFLRYNSIKENGKNKYEEIVKESYLAKAGKYFPNKFFSDFIDIYPNIRLMYSEGIYWPCFDYLCFLQKIFEKLIFTPSDEKLKLVKSIRTYDVERMKKIILSTVRAERWNVSEYLKKINILNIIQTQFFSTACNQIKKDNIKRKPKEIEKVLIEYRNNLDLLISFIEDTFDSFDNKIDYEELVSCFEYDKFNLIVVKGILDSCYNTLKSGHFIDRMIHIVQCYVNAVEKYRIDNPKYNPMIIIGLNHKKGKTYTYEDLKKKFGKYLEMAPEFKPGYIEEIFTDNEFPWEIISQGKKLDLNSDKVDDNTTGKPVKSKTTTPRSHKELRVVEGYEYLCGKKPINIFRGKNVFDGYLGFQYENGIVIFEKVYDKNGDIAIMNATYAMTINNFTYLSKRTKTEIIHILSKAKKGIWRFYHTENMESWRTKVIELITEKDYTQEDYDYIEELLELDNIKKRSKK